ncbi:MAG: hypothetical protein MJA31_08940, partial [Clostridia bacterium]|nr:hypothetical protein [Clostridia bacterium]
TKALAYYFTTEEHLEYLGRLEESITGKYQESFYELLSSLSGEKLIKNRIEDTFLNTYAMVGGELYKKGFYDCLDFFSEGFNGLTSEKLDIEIKRVEEKLRIACRNLCRY